MDKEMKTFMDAEEAFELLAQCMRSNNAFIILERFPSCFNYLQQLIASETNQTFKEMLTEVQSALELQQNHWRAILYNISSSTPYGQLGEIRMRKKLKTDKSNIADNSRKEAILGTVRSLYGGVTLNDIAGLDHVKSVLRKAILLPLQYPSFFTGKRKSNNHILLYGPPGTGKSKIVSAIANESQLTLFAISSADLFSSWVGESEKSIKDLFDLAKSSERRSIIFIDEIDSMCRKRNTNEGDYSRRIKNQLLIEMDYNLNGDTSCVLLCATNCPWDLDVAFMRRFQSRVFVPLPDEAARLAILKDHCAGIAINMTDDEWKIIVKNTEGYSGADLTNVAMCAVQEPLEEMNLWQSCSSTAGPNNQASNSETVALRDVRIHDFIKALHSTPKSVTTAELSKYRSFNEQSSK